MSGKPKDQGGFNPAKNTAYTLEELGHIRDFFTELIKQSNLRWAVVAAGIASILEIIHLFWLAVRFVLKF
jgi:hypothetical protein